MKTKNKKQTKMRKLSITMGMLMAVTFFVSCEKEQVAVVETVTSKTVTSLPADTIVGMSGGRPVGVGKYTFYSIESNSLISSADSNSKKWDIGLMATTIITNGGSSGPGSGGAFVYTGTFDELKTIPADSTFRTDNAPMSYAIPTGSNKGWYVLDFVTNILSPIPGRVMVIRTANGKYAKVEILSYYKGGVTLAANATDAEKSSKQRYYTFRFTYQSNGTKTF
jgi:hypothetical protein